ncbi:hypothetical protein ACROYT_G014638 [Oculina patagonica]
MQTQQETKATLIEDEDTDELFKLIEKGERVVELQYHYVSLPHKATLNRIGPDKTVFLSGGVSKQHLLGKTEMTVHENVASDLDNEEDFGYQEIKDVSKNLSQTYFERGELDNLVDDLSTMYAILADDSGLDFAKSPPASFDISSC